MLASLSHVGPCNPKAYTLILYPNITLIPYITLILVQSLQHRSCVQNITVYTLFTWWSLYANHDSTSVTISILILSTKITLGKQSWLWISAVHLPALLNSIWPVLLLTSVSFSRQSVSPLFKVAFRQLGHVVLQFICLHACLLHSAVKSPAAGAYIIHFCALLGTV